MVEVTASLAFFEPLYTLDKIPAESAGDDDQHPLSDALHPDSASVKQVDVVREQVPVVLEFRQRLIPQFLCLFNSIW